MLDERTNPEVCRVLIARSWKFGTTSFGSSTEAAKINTEKMLKQCAGDVAIFEFFQWRSLLQLVEAR
jgi:hypothetical protein